MNKIVYTKIVLIAALTVGTIAIPGSIYCQQNFDPANKGIAPDQPTVAIAVSEKADNSAPPIAKSANLASTETVTVKPVVSKPKTVADVPYEKIIVKAANTHQIDPALIKAIIMAESRYDPKAVSKRGARGLMQLMPVTAKSLGVKDSFNPEDNINGGVMYFKRLLDRFDGDVTLALAAYNAGSRYVRKYGGVPPFRQTRTYINKVFRYHKKYKQV